MNWLRSLSSGDSYGSRGISRPRDRGRHRDSFVSRSPPQNRGSDHSNLVQSQYAAAGADRHQSFSASSHRRGTHANNRRSSASHSQGHLANGQASRDSYQDRRDSSSYQAAALATSQHAGGHGVGSSTTAHWADTPTAAYAHAPETYTTGTNHISNGYSDQMLYHQLPLGHARPVGQPSYQQSSHGGVAFGDVAGDDERNNRDQ